LTFYINRTKEKKNGECPVMLRININGVRVALQLKRYLKPENWDTDKYRMAGRTDEARVFNEYIEAIKMKANKKYNELISMYDDVSPQMLRDEILGVNTAKPRMLIEIWNEHIEGLKKLIGKENSYATYQKYKKANEYMQSFLQKHYKVDDVSVKQIDHRMISEFLMFIKTEKNYAFNSAIKMLQKLKKIITISLHNGWITKDPFIKISFALKHVERCYLTEVELKKLMDYNSRIERINRVRDFFVFSCFTGLAYIDIKQLKRHEIEENESGFWIRTHRQKTGNRANIPILEVPMNIINKYCVLDALNADDPILPILSNQKMNAYLKELTDLCGISKELTFHIARHTFATTVTMMNGVPIESVSKMLGHKNMASTQIYARIVDQKVGEDMEILSRKLGTRFTLTH